ncbi:MAG TPA: hypothetical protein VGQ85_04350 [Candidatus Limnocylindrales bacterium]|nr:hypothetical protein [Candidatus Limnocylindrales bacterium]
MGDTRRTSLAALVLGGAIALLAQLGSPVAVPLYDGVQVLEPYRYLTPASGQPGTPTSFSAEKPVQGGVSTSFVAATKENPPQAQLIVLPGAFVVTAAATTMRISIDPVPRPANSGASGAIAGNVYRFAVTDQAGIPLPIAQGANPPTITLRGPDGVTEGTIALLGAGGSVLLPTEHGGALAIFSTNPPALGDFVVLVATAATAAPNIGLLVGAILAVAVPVALVVFMVVRQRRSRQLAFQAARQRTRIPSKRTPPRPPKGPGRRS